MDDPRKPPPRHFALPLGLLAMATAGVLLASCDRRPNPWEAAARAGGGKAVQQQSQPPQPPPHRGATPAAPQR